MIAFIGTILVWVLIVISAIVIGISAIIGLLVLVNFPSKFR